MNVKHLNTAKKSIKVMDHWNRMRVEKVLEMLPEGDILPVYYEHTYRMRDGKYRVIFAYDGNNGVIVHRVAYRGDIYKGINCWNS